MSSTYQDPTQQGGMQSVGTSHGLPVQVIGASGVPTFPAAVAAADGLAMPTTAEVIAVNALYNGATLDMMRNNVQGTLLASAARTTQTFSANQTNYNARGVAIFVDVTAASGTGGLSVTVDLMDPVSGNPRNMLNLLGPIIATGTGVYMLYPGLPSTTSTSVGTQDMALTRTWRLRVNVGDASSYTYSVGFSYII